MKRLIGAITAFAYLALTPFSVIAQTSSGISADSSQDSAQESSQDSSQNSIDQSSQDSSDSDSWGESSRSSSEQSSAGSSDQSAEGGDEFPTVSLIVAGAVTVVAVVGVIITVKAKKARQEPVIGLQDQIYLAQGKDYETVRDFFGLSDEEIAMANDELVTEGYLVVDDQSAADYLAALMLKCARRSEKIKAELAI